MRLASPADDEISYVGSTLHQRCATEVIVGRSTTEHDRNYCNFPYVIRDTESYIDTENIKNPPTALVRLMVGRFDGLGWRWSTTTGSG